jgi:hypothetical protein
MLMEENVESGASINLSEMLMEENVESCWRDDADHIVEEITAKNIKLTNMVSFGVVKHGHIFWFYCFA